MNKKIVRRYISEIKAICPFRGRGERKYLSWFSNNVWVYCEENDIQDIDELYRQFGKPNDVVNHYLTGMDIDEISNKIVKIKMDKTYSCRYIDRNYCYVINISGHYISRV